MNPKCIICNTHGGKVATSINMAGEYCWPCINKVMAQHKERMVTNG